MRRLVLFLLLLALALPVTAAPTITVLHSSIAPEFLLPPIERLQKDFPGVKVELVEVDLSTGSTISMDANIRAGTPPNIYIDTSVRTSKYIVPEYALPLNGLVRDLDKYAPGVLDPVTRDGKVLALPQHGSAQGMCINLDMMAESGYTIPKDWTIADFLKMAALVKARYGAEKWATGMFASNQSGDYLINNWFAAFGVQFYKPGQYDKSVIADTGGARVYKFFQDLVRAGYVPPNAATLTDDDYAVQWETGRLGATAFFEGWTDAYFKNALDQGLIKKPHAYKFIAFPRGPGVSAVPTYFSGGVIVGHKTGTDVDRITARLMEYLNSAEIQLAVVKANAVVSTRIDVPFTPTNPRLLEVMEIMKTNGLQDVGLFDPRFTERRATQYPILQRVLNLTITPEAAIAQYQAALNAVK